MNVTRLPDHALPVDVCQCVRDEDWYACVDGAVYGPCEDENCTGACEYKGGCPCACHRAHEAEKAAAGR